MKAYIGTKVVRAEPMDEVTAMSRNLLRDTGVTIDARGQSRQGYRVVYPDGYESWSPRDVFDAAYREISDGEVATIGAVPMIKPSS